MPFSTHTPGAYQGPIIDSHIHLFDPRRPQGVPWPAPDSPIYRPMLAESFFETAATHGVTGAVVIEASPWRDDNTWLLRQAQADLRILGVVGCLLPGPDFSDDLEHYLQNPLFLGLRYGNLWDCDLGRDLANPQLLQGMRRLAEANRCLDSANPTPDLIAALLRLSDAMPGLRLVLDHLPQAQQETGAYWHDLAELAQRETVFMKLSEVPRTFAGEPSFELSRYRERLDRLWELFGANRTLFGSDWPNSEHLGSYAQTLELTRAYLASKPLAEQERCFFSNSQLAYRWQPRPL